MNIGVLILVGVVILLFMVGCSSIERELLFFPTHHDDDFGLEAWVNEDSRIGYARKVESPKNVWLMLHGNAGQAADRVHALPRFSAEDSVYIVEYPGYGQRKGRPSKKTFNQAAEEAYLVLRHEFPSVPVCVVGESLGSGPSSYLASLPNPPDKVVLMVPFEKLSAVARERYPGFVVSILLSSDWDNAATLSQYSGPVEIYGAEFDTVIPVYHAKSLADQIEGGEFIPFEGAHNEWSEQEAIRIRNP